MATPSLGLCPPHRISRISACSLFLDALKESGEEENTLVIFSSDHGDMDGSHRMEHKSTLYEESTNIPFMAMWKGHILAGQVDENSFGIQWFGFASDRL